MTPLSSVGQITFWSLLVYLVFRLGDMAFRGQLAAILDYVASLDELGVELIAPTQHAPLGAVELRADEVVASLPIDEVLRGAPDSAAGLFRVPKVLAE